MIKNFVLSLILTQMCYADIGLIGPNGQTVYITRKADQIIIQNCKTNTVLGRSRADAQVACVDYTYSHFRKAKSNLPLNYFKELARSEPYYKVRDNELSSIELESLWYQPLSDTEVRTLVQEQIDIENYIREYGLANANIIRLSLIKERLARNSLLLSLLSSSETKWNAMITSLEYMISDPSVHIIPHGTDSDLLTYQILVRANETTNVQGNYEKLVSRFDCGLSGTRQERIEDCTEAYGANATTGTAHLVTSKYPHSIYWDTDSLTYFAFFGGSSTFNRAQENCSQTFKGLFFENSDWLVPTKSKLNHYLKGNSSFRKVMINNQNTPNDRARFPKKLYSIWTSTESRSGKSGFAVNMLDLRFYKEDKSSNYMQIVCFSH